MRQCNLYEAKARLSELVKAALDGEEVFIARSGQRAVRLVPVAPSQSETLGWGTLVIDPAALDEAFRPELEDEIANLFHESAKSR